MSRPTFTTYRPESLPPDPLTVDLCTTDTQTWAPRFPSADGSDRPPPHPRRWAPAVMRAILEVLSGYRPVTHLNRWVSLELYQNLARQAALVLRLGREHVSARPSLRRLQLSSVSAGRVNMIGTFFDGKQVRALAGELVVRKDRWVVTDLQIG